MYYGNGEKSECISSEKPLWGEFIKVLYCIVMISITPKGGDPLLEKKKS